MFAVAIYTVQTKVQPWLMLFQAKKELLYPSTLYKIAEIAEKLFHDENWQYLER